MLPDKLSKSGSKDSSFILLDLNEDDAKQLANAIGSKSGKQILDYLANKRFATETEIAEDLDLPISTVHYNLQSLVKARLVEADEYHYSKKKKEIIHYRVANKFIIIAPKGAHKESILDKLKSIVPIGIIALGIGALSVLARKYFADNSAQVMGDAQPSLMMESARMLKTSGDEVASEALSTTVGGIAQDTVVENITEPAADVFAQTAMTNQDALMNIPPPAQEVIIQPGLSFEQMLFWFALGVLVTAIVYVIFTSLSSRRTGK